jgi:cytochrome c oxidase subunit 4
MAERSIAPRTYYLVLAALLALTVLTTGLSFVNMRPGVLHVVVGLLIALAKATLVVLFFMHALVSPRLTWIVILVSVFWLGILLVLMMSDYLTRGQVPYMPGH